MSGPRSATLAAPRVAAAGLVAWLVLFGSVQVGLSTPDREELAASPAGAGLDYSRVSGTFPQLTEAFIAQALGLPDPAQDVGLADLGIASPDVGSAPVAAGPATGAAAVSGARVEVTHPPDNDDFAQAYEVPSVPFAATTDGSRASRESGEPSCAPTGPTLWYRYSATETIGLTAHAVVADNATSVGVFVGSALRDLREVGCHSSVSGPAGVRFTAEAATTYFFQVGAPLGARTVRFGLDPLGATTRVPNQGDWAFTSASCGPAGGSAGPSPRPHEPQFPGLSADGRFATFQSYYSESWPYVCWDDRTPLGADETLDTFVYDRARGQFEQVSVNSQGEPADERSGTFWAPFPVSADGRFVGFWSGATNLVPDDTNDSWDVFVRDRATPRTTRVSVSSDGQQGEAPPRDLHDDWDWEQNACQKRDGGRDGAPGPSGCVYGWSVDMTTDGRYVVFEHDLRGLAEETSDGQDDIMAIYRHDRLTGETIVVTPPDQHYPARASISADGSKVAYAADIDEPYPLLPLSMNGSPVMPGEEFKQIWVRDLRSDEPILVSRGYDGQPANGLSYIPRISADGRYVAFASAATNLVPDDANGDVTDVFVYDLVTGETEIATVNSAGEQHLLNATTNSFQPFFLGISVSISGDGRYVVFASPASNLAPDDPDAQRSDTGRSDCTSGTDVFVRDMVAGTTTMVSVSNEGHLGNGCSFQPSISPDGSTVAFVSAADNLVEGDRNGPYGYDLFFHDFWVPPGAAERSEP